jgi:Transposase DDE domain
MTLLIKNLFLMLITHQTNTVGVAFFSPLEDLTTGSLHAWPCSEFSDEDYVNCGVQRVLEACVSGRAFLQEHGHRWTNPPTQSNYFATLHSSRRVALLADVNHSVLVSANQRLPDRLAEIPELALYDCFAADGHWHKAAAHDARHEGTKMAVGHVYSLNLRTHTLGHLTASQGLHEHDMSALKRIKPKGLRQGVPRGRRVLIVYDKAGIDFDYWKRCRQECAVYFLSRVKENMILGWEQPTAWDKTDPRNRGVFDDFRVRSREGHALRMICYVDPISGRAFEFLTNEMDLPPGVLVELYRCRWNVEKVFDELKNKLEETKAWASSLTAKATQAQFLSLTHNLLLLYEQALEIQHDVENHSEDQRREKRTEHAVATSAKVGKPISTLVIQARRATQHSVKFIRWIRQSIRDQVAEATAVPRLKLLYANL